MRLFPPPSGCSDLCFPRSARERGPGIATKETYLTHGFKKKRDKWPDSELAKAERIRSEHIERTRGKR